MDQLDRAQQLEENERQHMLDKHVKREPIFSRPDCIDCGDAIPKARQAIGGVERCISCQTDHEQQRRHMVAR